MAGSQVHKLIEDGKQGEPALWNEYDIGIMAQKLHDATPPDVISREETFTETVDGVPFTGVIDFQTPDTVGDYKTTGKRRNIKSLKVLTNDPQRLLYVQVKQPARTLWLYGVWEDMTVTPRELVVEKEDRERFKLHVLTPAEEILSVSPDTDPLSLPANLESCRMYPPVGCPYADQCFPTAKISEGIANRMSDIVKRLMAEAEAKEPSINAPSVPAAEAPAEPASEKKRRPPKTEQVSEVDREIQAAQQAEQANMLIENLYIDCIPLSSEFTHAYLLLAEASQMVADDMQLPHAMLVDFAKGGPMVAAQLVANLRKKPVQNLAIETKSPEGKACMTALMGVSRNVFKGVF